MRNIWRRKRSWGVLLAMLVGLGCVSCAIFPGPDRTVIREQDRQKGASSVSLTTPFVELDGRRGGALVGIAISGGGSRAANFAASVMAELDRMGLLDKVTAISSVSGGSVAASYFALNGDDKLRLSNHEQFWGNAKETLSQDFRSRWMARWLRPDNLIQTTFSGSTRTDVMAEIFDEAFLGKATFSQLAGKRPALFIDATALNDQPGRLVSPFCTNRGDYAQRLRWESISFTDQFFAFCLNASFDKFPISSAVVASAAFPGVFNSVALKRFDGKPDEPSYVHLIDGGPSDNLGMDGILGQLTPGVSASPSTPKACLLIVIDAFAIGDPDLRHEESDTRGVLGRVVDPNFFDAMDSMLARRRHDTLQRLGLPPTRQLDASGGFIVKHDFPIKGQQYAILGSLARFKRSVSASAAMGEEADPSGVQCAVWHIALDNIPALMAGQAVEDGKLVTMYDPQTPGEKLAQTEVWFARPEVKHRVHTYELASRLRTDFNLNGPERCNREQLRDGVWEAGRLAVQDDWKSRKSVCEWARDRGWIVKDSCDAPPEPTRTKLKIELIPAGKSSSSYDVACKSD